MRGLVARLNLWLQRAAAGTLDPDGQPLHPPAVYASYDNGSVVVTPDLGELVPWREQVTPGTTATLYAWCQRNGTRVDVVEWLQSDAAYDRVLADGFEPRDKLGNPFFVVPVLLISDELGMEYPSQASMLAESLEQAGIARDELLRMFTSAGTFNRAIGSMAGVSDEAPLVVMLGTPARRVEGTRRLAHLSAWRIDGLGKQIMDLLGKVQSRRSDLTDEVRSLADQWLGFAKTSWMVMHESRPEVTRRRDEGSSISWLSGKRVLILGCGALGAPVAEQCVRAGVSSVTVVDNAAVRPGLLVRQPYDDADIGFGKATMLARNLSRIRRDLTVDGLIKDAVHALLANELDPLQFDLIVDATADIGTRAALESVRASSSADWPPILTGLFGHEATRGLVVVARGNATGSAHDILRRVAIDARAQAAGTWSDIADDFFPDPPRTEIFLPEPGCSSPTFVGSATQANALASMLLWAGVQELTEYSQPMAAVAVRLPGSGATAGAFDRLTWPNDVVARDETGEYVVLVSQRAMAEIRAEVRRGARVRGRSIETGGMLLGSFDEATGRAYIDAATGPSPDSQLSAMYFSHGTAGTQEVIDHSQRRSANRVGFVGMWHSHPYGPASPSPTDEAGMAWIVSPDGVGRRALMMIIGGRQKIWDAWRADGDLPDIYARVVGRNDSSASRSAGGSRAIVPPGPFFAGGYSVPTIDVAPDPVRPAWWLRWRTRG